MPQQSIEIPVPACKSDSSWRSQFSHPSGWRGWIVGRLMAVKNKTRSSWVLSLLQLRPTDHVLELGFGSGADIRRVAARVPQGFVAGVDHSESMVRLATSKNAAMIAAGRVRVLQSSASRLPFESNSFDVAFSINVAQFWNNPAEVALEIRRVLKPDGCVALAVQPRNKGANETDADATGEKLMQALAAAGFTLPRLERKPLRPVSVVCAIASK
jgi:ubiquinone/menaquinone biosynthesis C-methylase UbiE